MNRKKYLEQVKAKISNQDQEDIENAKNKPFKVMVEKEVERNGGNTLRITVFEPESNKWDGTEWKDTTLKGMADGGIDLEKRPPSPAFFQQSLDSMSTQLNELQEQLDYYQALQSKQTTETSTTTTEQKGE